MLRIALALAMIPLLGVPCLAEDTPASNARITLQMKDAELVEVIKAISEAAKANVIMSPKVSGKVSIDVRDVPWRQALKQVVEGRRFRVIEQQYGIVRVIPSEEVTLEQDYYRFQHWRPKQTARGPAHDPTEATPTFLRALTQMLELDGGNLRYIPQENAAIFNGTLSTLKALKQVLAALDRSPMHVTIAGSGIEPQAKRPPPPRSLAEIRRYEELLRDAKTETAAKYFVKRLGDLRAAKPKKKDLYGETVK